MKHLAKVSIAAAALAAPLAIIPSAQAQQTYAQCISQQRNQQVTGAVVGGVLGAVLGAQIHQSNESARRDRHYANQPRHRGWRGHRGRGYVEPYQRRSNDGAVIAGAGLGALAGGAMGSVGSRCDHLPGGPRYVHHSQYQHPHYGGQQYGYSQQGYDPYYDDYGYYDNSQLAGGPGYDPYYQQQPAQPQVAGYGYGNCRQIQTAGRIQYVCQGADGIWRPAN